MANVKDVTIRIKTIDGDLKKTGNKFDNLNNKVNKGSKQMSNSMSKLGKSIVGIGASMAGAFAIKAVITDAVKRIVDFEKAMSSLSAITGITEKTALEGLKKKVLEVAKETKKSAVEVAKSFELIGSKAPKLLENADALAKVTEKAIILSKASGEDLVDSSTALTGVMNQFNLEATESERIINALAAGSQKGAAPVGQISEAIDKFGTVADSANVSVESSIGLVETLAEKNINGAVAGTQLRNIILKLQAANIGFSDGVFNLNDALQEVKDKNLSAAESAKLFGLESVTAGNILVNNVDTVNKYTDAVTGTDTANEQAAIQMDNVAGRVEELDSTYETFILSIEDGSGVLSDFVKNAVAGFSSILEGLTDLNQFDFSKIFDADSMRSFTDSISELGISINKIMNPALAETGEKFREISNKNLNQITDKFRTLTIEQLKNRDTAKKIVETYVKLGFSAGEARDKYIELVKAQKKSTTETDKNTDATDDNTVSTDNNNKSKEKAISFTEKLADKVKDAKDKIKEADLLNTIFDDTGEFTESEDFLKLVGLDDESLDKEKEAREKKQEIKDEAAQAAIDKQLEYDQLEIEQQQALADAKTEINQQLLFSSLGLAEAIAQAAGDSQEAQIAALAFEKVAAIASIIINTAKTNALLASQLGVLAPPAILANNVNGAIQVATVLATAIPQIQQIQKPKEPKKLREGEVLISGDGTETSDSIPAMLSKNESIINAKSSKKHTAALKAINDDRFDEYLNRILIKEMYSPQNKPKIIIKEAKKEPIKFPKSFRVSNAKAISNGIREAMEEYDFLNQGNGWE